MGSGPGVTPTILGVDFSGASDAGRKIWLSRGTLDERGRLHVEACRRAADLPGGSAERTAALSALRAEIVASRCVCGLDFPIGLPRALLNGDDWRAFLAGFAGRYADAAGFREACTVAAGGRELRRATDLAARTPFCPYNLRLYRQTYYGIRDVIRPLVLSGGARVLPMQQDEVRESGAWATTLRRGSILIEICPASLLKRLDRYVAYKGRSDAHRRERARLLADVCEREQLVLPGRELRATYLDDPEGDALDSLLAAAATARAVRSEALLSATGDADAMLEGWVYC